MSIRRGTVTHLKWGCLKGRHKNLSLLALLMLAAVTGCTQSNSPLSQAEETTPQPQKLEVVATFLPIYWFTKAVAGDLAKVDILIPPGTEVHEYQAKPEDVQAIATADVLVKNGLGLEEFLAGTVKNAQNAQLRVIDSSKGIEPIGETASVVQADTEHEHEHEAGNPHIWLDPVRAKQQVVNIRDGLIAADPKNKATYQANATAYIQELEALNRQFQQSLQKYPNCTFVTFHNAYPYLASRYGLQQVAVVELPEDQLSPTDVQKTINAVRQYKVKALFGEPGVDNTLLQGLSKDLNLTLHPLNSLETGPLEPQYYFTAMKSNLQTLESACR